MRSTVESGSFWPTDEVSSFTVVVGVGVGLTRVSEEDDGPDGLLDSGGVDVC